MEYRLRQLDIPYQYFDLDNDNYDIFECTNKLPSTYTHPDWDLTDNKTYSNWTILRDIAEEYIELRNLHDMRLDATITGQSSWYREGSGVSAANFAAQASGDDKFAKFILNADAYSSPAGQNARVNLRLYGVS